MTPSQAKERGIKVVALDWVNGDKQPPHAVSFAGMYLLAKDFDGWRWMRTEARQLADVCKAPFADETEARTAAQADYEARILAALE